MKNPFKKDENGRTELGKIFTRSAKYYKYASNVHYQDYKNFALKGEGEYRGYDPKDTFQRTAGILSAPIGFISRNIVIGPIGSLIIACSGTDGMSAEECEARFDECALAEKQDFKHVRTRVLSNNQAVQ